jgi:hypothetical protein
MELPVVMVFVSRTSPVMFSIIGYGQETQIAVEGSFVYGFFFLDGRLGCEPQGRAPILRGSQRWHAKSRVAS